MKITLGIWQITGFIFTGLLGVLLHFLYDITGESVLVSPFCAVNESIWEHIKLLYFPLLLFTLLQSRFLKEKYPNFWCAKLLGFVIGLSLIPTLYYLYTGALGMSADWFNIAIFFISAFSAYFTEYFILKRECLCHIKSGLAIFIILTMGAVLILFTYIPPHIPLFQDPITKTYGII